jgi:hypothetical protein
MLWLCVKFLLLVLSSMLLLRLLLHYPFPCHLHFRSHHPAALSPPHWMPALYRLAATATLISPTAQFHNSFRLDTLIYSVLTLR